MVKGVRRNPDVSHIQEKKTERKPQRNAIKSAAMTEFVVGRTHCMSTTEASLKGRKMSLGSKNPTDKKVCALGLNSLFGKKRKH